MRMRRAVLSSLLAVVVSVPFASTAAAGPAERSASEEPTYVELKAPKPDWYTQSLHDRVMAAAERGESVPVPEGVDYDASGLAFTGIRPGAWIIAPAGCTTNFVFGSARDYYIGTAGHCTSVGDEVTLVAAPGVLMNIGTTVKSVDRGIGNDFALIDVRPEMEQYVNPSMALLRRADVRRVAPARTGRGALGARPRDRHRRHTPRRGRGLPRCRRGWRRVRVGRGGQPGRLGVSGAARQRAGGR